VDLGANLPPDVTHILARHGPVQVWAGPEDRRRRHRLTVAPFEDEVYLLVRPGSPLLADLSASVRLALDANAPDGAYRMHLEGRAWAGLALTRHPRASSLMPWVPDDLPPHRAIVVPFVAESVDLVRAQGEGESRFRGPTPAGRSRRSPLQIWLRAALGGLAIPFAVTSAIGPWVWLVQRGADFPARFPAWLVSLLGALGLLGGARLLAVHRGYVLWRAGRAEASDAPVLAEGLMAPATARRTGTWGVIVGAALTSAVALGWGPATGLVALASSGAWLVGPAWALHLLMGRPEKRPPG
jgi:hypothetical protein